MTSALPAMAEISEAPSAPPSRTSLIWLFVRWLPSVLLVTLLTMWALVAMGGLARVMGWLGLLFFAPAAGLFVVLGVTAYAAVRRRVSRPVIVAWILGALVILPGLWPKGILAIPYPASAEDEPSLSIRVPTDEQMRVYWGGPELERNYHALYPDQRWAYDLVVEPAGSLSSNPDDYGCWGVPVVAPVKGVVSSVLDGEPDQIPGQVADTEAFAGNHVVIKAEQTGTYLVIAHLMKGSVAVRAGQNVEPGTPVGRCGNSGRTSEPHVHVHHQRQEVGPFPLGFAEGLPLFFKDHEGPRMPSGGADKTSDRVVLTGDEVRHLP